MKKLFALIPLVLVTLTVSAQTKRIALLSHAGKLTSLHMKSEGNFGEGPGMYYMRDIDKKYWDSVFRADSARIADSLARIPRKPQTDAGTKQDDPAKPQQSAPETPNPQKAGTWLGKSRR